MPVVAMQASCHDIYLFIFIEKPQTFRHVHVNVHMIYSVHTHVLRRQHRNGSGGETWAARPTVGLGVNTGHMHMLYPGPGRVGLVDSTTQNVVQWSCTYDKDCGIIHKIRDITCETGHYSFIIAWYKHLPCRISG